MKKQFSAFHCVKNPKHLTVSAYFVSHGTGQHFLFAVLAGDSDTFLSAEDIMWHFSGAGDDPTVITFVIANTFLAFYFPCVSDYVDYCCFSRL